MMITLNPSDATILLAILAGLIATFGPTVFMLQSRHHGIDEHERKLQDKYEELMKAGPENSGHCQNILDQIDIVRKRYNAALTAFILVMAQEVILVLTVVAVAILYNVIQWYFGLLIIPGALALGLHIYGDLRPAFVTQARSRAWLDRKTEKGGGLRPKLND